MPVERLNSCKPYEETLPLHQSRLYLVNNTIGIASATKHDQVHLSVYNGKTLTSLTNHFNSPIFNKLQVEDLEISAFIDKDGSPQVRITSKTPFQPTQIINQPDFFKKKMEYWKNRKKEATKLSGLLKWIITNLDNR